ncbi:hypothetical protein ACFX10_023516 [Malus domestica]
MLSHDVDTSMELKSCTIITATSSPKTLVVKACLVPLSVATRSCTKLLRLSLSRKLSILAPTPAIVLSIIAVITRTRVIHHNSEQMHNFRQAALKSKI